MNENNGNSENMDNIQPDPQPEPEEMAPADAEAQSQEALALDEDQAAAPEKQPPSKFVRILRKALIGLGIAAALFLAGFLTDHFTRFAPLSKQLERTQAELEDAEQAVSDLQDENERLASANQDANDAIERLEDQLAAAKANGLFYQVLVDVNTARLRLFMEESKLALAALENTREILEELQPVIEAADPELALSLPRRLDLIISGIPRDPETALIDLALLTKDLLALEPQLALE